MSVDAVAGHELADRTWPDLGRPILLVPVGSCEQHGPHLPIGTDTLIATTVARAAADRRDDCLVAPALTITASGEHQGFPGTLSIGTDVLVSVLIELARSAEWADGVAFVNGHGGNVGAMQRASVTFEQEQRRVMMWWPRPPEHRTDLVGDLHAGRIETSLLLALAPHLVDEHQAAAGPSPTPPVADLVRFGVQPYSSNGVLGDPTGATAEEGLSLLAHLVDDLSALLTHTTGR